MKESEADIICLAFYLSFKKKGEIPLAKKAVLCSLFVLNLSSITRSVSRSILHPNRGGLVHFHTLNHIEYALELEKNKEIEIQTEIPEHILAQLNLAAGSVEVKKLDEVKVKETVEQEDPNEETEVAEGEQQAVAEVEKEPEVTEVSVPSEGTEKPSWYLTWEQVEEMSKPKLIEHFEEIEEVNFPRSKNAEQTKELVHAELAKLFEDHAAPAGE